MRVRPTASAAPQLSLSTRNPVEMSRELEEQLVSALAELLIAVAANANEKVRPREGARDERQDP